MGRVSLTLAFVCACVSTTANASPAEGDPSGPVVLALAIILICAKFGGALAVRLKQPAVLGELMVGVALGNASLLGIQVFEPMANNPFLDMFARVGVIILLFEVGLESTVSQMMKVGTSALLVAVIGVVTPFILGFAATRLMMPEHSIYVALFIGATLTATSVGITARVLKDLERSQTPEARIILGAAVIDDVLGLVILAVVTGVIAAANEGQAFSVGKVAVPLVKAIGFLVGALVLGLKVSKRLFGLASQLHVRGVLLAFGLGFCFALAFLADFIGLAPIVGAFAAGLIFEDVHYTARAGATSAEETLEELIHPISYFLVPVFFVLMGMHTKLASFVQPGVAVLSLVLCVVAVAGKLVAGLGARGQDVRKLVVGIGMVPRGEVGLIFADLGSKLSVQGEPVISNDVFSAVVLMVIVTTVLTPPLLSWSSRGHTSPTSAT